MPDLLHLPQALVHARGERAAGRGDDEVVGRDPVELLDHLEGHRLRPLGVERPQGDVGELDAARQGELAAGAVGFVVVAVELDHGGAERPAGAGLAALEVARVEDVGGDARLGGQRGDRGADVAGRDAADLLLAQLEQPGDRHRDDAVLVGEAGALGAVVLEVELAQAELGAEPVGVDQRRAAAVAADPRLRPGVDDRQQLLEAPDVDRPLRRRQLGQPRRRQLVVVVDVEPLAAAEALEGRVEKGQSKPAVVADQLRRAGAGALVGREAHRPSSPRASEGRPPAFANLPLRFPC